MTGKVAWSSLVQGNTQGAIAAGGQWAFSSAALLRLATSLPHARCYVSEGDHAAQHSTVPQLHKTHMPVNMWHKDVVTAVSQLHKTHMAVNMWHRILDSVSVAVQYVHVSKSACTLHICQSTCGTEMLKGVSVAFQMCMSADLHAQARHAAQGC